MTWELGTLTNQDLAELLRLARVERAMTQADAGEIFGVDGYTFARWEQGQAIERYASFWRGLEILMRRPWRLGPMPGHKSVVSGLDDYHG